MYYEFEDDDMIMKYLDIYGGKSFCNNLSAKPSEQFRSSFQLLAPEVSYSPLHHNGQNMHVKMCKML